MPLWWYLVHALSKGVTHAAVASVPCGSDFRQVRFEVRHTTLADPLIFQEVQEFAAQCYAKAYYRLKHSRSGLTAEEAEAVNWIGSDWFLSTPAITTITLPHSRALHGRTARLGTVVFRIPDRAVTPPAKPGGVIKGTGCGRVC